MIADSDLPSDNRTRGLGRNSEIFDSFTDGLSSEALSIRFGISTTRVYQIIAAEKARRVRTGLPMAKLSARTINRLINNGRVPVRPEDLSPTWVAATFDEMDLAAIPNLGRKGQAEVLSWVRASGLSLRRRKVVWTRKDLKVSL